MHKVKSGLLSMDNHILSEGMKAVDEIVKALSEERPSQDVSKEANSEESAMARFDAELAEPVREDESIKELDDVSDFFISREGAEEVILPVITKIIEKAVASGIDMTDSGTLKALLNAVRDIFMFHARKPSLVNKVLRRYYRRGPKRLGQLVRRGFQASASESKGINETGEMDASDLAPGGEWHDTAKDLEAVAKSTGMFVKVRPFDNYRGPYALLKNGDKLWVSDEEGKYMIEPIDGDASEADALGVKDHYKK